METMIKKHKSHRYCSVPHCKSTCSKEISLFLFPKSKDLAKQWSDILDIRRQATKYIYVCSLHFDKKDFSLSMSAKKRRLKNGAVPSKNLPVKPTSSGPRATQLREIEDNKLRGPNKRERVPFKKMLKDGASNSDSLAECRACLQLCSNEEQHNLFKCWDPPWAGMENTPAEDLSKLACVQISQTDTHSKILCHSCYTHLQNACQFVEIVKKADEVLSLRIGVNNPHTPDSWPKPIQVDKNVPYDKVQIKDEIFSDEETQQINEEDFSNVDVKIEADDWPSQSVHINGIISLGQLNKEMAEINGYLPDVEQNGKINGLTSEGPITNGVVNYKHDKADSFNTNCLIVSVKDEPVSDDESETNASELPLDCILCCKTFSSLTGLKAHVIAQHSYKVLRRRTIDDAQESLLNNVCKICKRRFETSTDLMVHETCHNMCVCYGCNTSFETFDQLSQHRQSCMALKNSEVGKVLKLEDVQRMANIAQRILEVITKFTIFSQNSEHGNIDECYQALLAVITQKEDSICDDLSCDDDDSCNLSDLESCDDTLLEYNKRFLSDLHLQKKSSKLIESSVVEHNNNRQTDDDFNSMKHSVKAIKKLLPYPVVKITRLESPILQKNKSSHLYDNHSDTTSSYEDFEELDEFLLDSDQLLISSHKRADGVEKQMAKENENQLILSNSEFSTEIDISKDIILHPDFNDIHEKSLSSSVLLFNASNSITEEKNIDSLDFDDDDDEFHTDNVSVCLDILSKYFPDETENDENFAKSSTQTSSKVAFKSSFALNVANTHLNPVANDEIINLIDESNDIDNFKKPCIVEPISDNINTSISQIPQKNTTDIASRVLKLFNISEPRVIENASIINANLDTTPLSLSGDKTINYICQKPLTTCALKSNIVNEHCSDVLTKQTGTEEMNLRNFYKLHANETHGIEKHRIKNKSHVIATDAKISENTKLQTAKLSTSIVGSENDVIGSDIYKDKKASSRELPSSVTCDTNSQTFQPLPRLVGVNNKFIFRYRSTRKIRRGCKMDCKFGCRKIFTSHLRYNKFKDFWKMDLSAQSKFLDGNVVKKIPRKLPRNRFFLPNSNESVRVCRKFIEDTFSILMLSYRKEFKKCKLSCDYYSNVGKKDTKVLDCGKKQTLSECVSSIDIFKENKTNSNGDTKQWDVIKKSNNIAQSNYGAEKYCISSIHRNINSNLSNGDTPMVHCSMKNDHKRLVDKTGSEINKNMSELNLKICSKKSKVQSSTRSNEYASGARNIKKRYRYNNITINVSTSEKVSFSRSNPYVKLIDIGFYTQLHSLGSPETSSTNSTQTHSQLVKNIDFSNIFQNVDPSPSYQSDKNNLSYRIDTDLDIPNNDSNSQGILENEVKTNFSHSPFDDLTAKDINCQSILHDKLNSEIANDNQQISNVHTNCRTLLHDEIKTKTLPLVIEEFQASDEESNSQSILQNEIESNLYLSNNINSEITNNYSSSYSIDGHDYCSSVKDLPKSYLKSNKQNTIEDHLPLLNLPKITKYQVSECHIRDKIDDNFPHLPAKDLVPSNEGSNLQDELETNPLLVNLNPQCTDEDSKCNDMTNHIIQLSGKDFSNEESMNEQSMTGEIEHNDDSSYHSDNARDIIDYHLPHLPIEHLAPSNEGSNLQHEIVNKLPLSLNSNPQCTNEDSRCNDSQNHLMRLSGGDLSNEESMNEQSMTGEIEHNDDSSYHSDSARDIIDHHLPHLPIEHLAPSNEGSNLQHEIVNKLPLSLNPNPQCTNEDSRYNDSQNHLMRLSGGDLSNEESENKQSMTGEIEHNDDSSYHSDSARDIIDPHLPHLPIEQLAPSIEGSNLQHEIVNKLPLLLNPNPQCTNEDSRCNDTQNNIIQLSGGDLSNEESENKQSMTGEIEHNDDSSYHSDSARDIIDPHLPHLPIEQLAPSIEGSNLQHEIVNKLPLLLNPNPQCTNEDSRCNDTQNYLMRLSGGDLSNEESENKQSMMGEIEHNDDSSYHSDSARDIIDPHLPRLPIEQLAPSIEGSNLQHEIVNKLPLSLNPNPQCTNEDSRYNDSQNHLMRLSGGDLSNEESENKQSMTGEIEHNDDCSYHSDSARDIIDPHLPHLPIEQLAPSIEGSNLQHEIVNKLPLLLNPNPQCTNEDSRCNDTQNNIIQLSGGDLSNEESENKQSMTGEIEHNDDSSYHSDSARDIIDPHLPHLPIEQLAPSIEGSNLQHEIVNKLPLLLNPNPQCTNEDSRCNDTQNYLMRLSGGDLSNEESENKQSMMGEIEHNDDSSYHSDSARDIIDPHLPRLPIEQLAPSIEGSNLQHEIVNKLPVLLNPNSQCTNEDSRCNDTQNYLMRLSGGDLSNEESENKQSMTDEIEHNDDSSYRSDSARDIIDDHLPPLPIENLAPSNEGSNFQHEMENNLPLLLNPNPLSTNKDSRCNDIQNHIMRLSDKDLSNEETENQQSMTGEIEHNDDSIYHSDSARDIIDPHLPHLPIEQLAPSIEGSNLQHEIVNKLPLLLNPNSLCTNEDSRCNDTQNYLMRLSGGDLSNEESENKQSMTDEIEHNDDSSYRSDSARDIIDDHLPPLPIKNLAPSNEGSNFQHEMEKNLPLLLNPNPLSTNKDSRCNDIENHIMRLSDNDLSNEETENKQSMAGEIQHEGSSCHSIRQDLIKNHLPHISNENLMKSSDESSGRTYSQNDIINKLPLSSNIQITNADAFCEVLCDSRIKHEDSNDQNIIYSLNDDPQNYNRDSPRSTIGEETTIKTLTHTFHTDTQCYDKYPKIAQDLNSSTIFDYPNTNLQIDNNDIIQQQNVKTNLSHLTITNSLTYNNIGNGESYCHISSDVLESQISIDESNSSQMSLKCSVPENTPEVYFERLFHTQSKSLIDGKINLKQHYRKKSNQFKLQRIIGKGYKFIFRYKVTRSLRPGCQYCTYKCTQTIGFDQRRVLFENFWKMDIHAQTSYLNENVFLINPILGLHDINETRMKRNHKFFFTVYGKRFRVCKKFFLNTLSILMTDLKNDSSRLKVIRERLNPHVKLIDIGFHKEPQPAIEVVSCMSNHTSSVETFGPGSYLSASLDSYSKLDMHSSYTKIKLPENVRLEAVNVDHFQSNSSDSQSQSPVYAQLSTVDQYYDKQIVTNICSFNAEPCDKNTHLMKPHEINSIGPFLTNVTQANKKEQSFKAILNNWSKPQDPLDKQTRALFKCTTNYNQISTKNCTHTPYIKTKSDSFYEIDDELKNMDILYENSSDSANTSLLDLRQTISVPNLIGSDDHINKVAFGTKSYERSHTEVSLKDSQIQNASALSSLSSAETNPGVESQTEIQEDKVTDALQLSTQNVCAVSELPKNIDSVLIATDQYDINSAPNQSEWQLGHRERGNIITTTAVPNLLPTFTNSINDETTKLTNSVYGFDKITIDQNTSVINIDEEKSLDATEKHTNVIQDNTDLNEQLNPNQASVTSDIAMESFKCSTLNIEISNHKFPSNTDSLAKETDGVVTPIQDKKNLNNSVTLLSDLEVQNQNYYNTKDNPCSSPKETSFTYTDSCNSNSEYLESKEMQLINDNRLESDYVQLSNVYEPPCTDSYLITKNTYYGTESSCSHIIYDTRSTRNCSQSSLDFYPSFDIENVVESDVSQSFESILNDWAS